MNFTRKSASPLALTAVIILSLASAHPAHAQTFTFEAEAATSNNNSHPGAFSTLSETSGGLTATFTRQNGDFFDIVDTATFSSGFPASFGTRSLDPFVNQTGATPFTVDFSAPVTSAAFDYGDFGGDADTFTLNAYSGLDGTGTLLATASDTYGTNSLPTFDTISASAAGIRSITFIGGSTNFPNSVYYDNLRVTQPAPEPSQFAALGIGLLGLSALAIKAKRRTAL